MFNNSIRLLTLFAWLVISLAHSITPVIKEGATDLKTAPFNKIGNGYYYVENQIKANWFTAFENCRQMDANLLSLETSDEWLAITRYLNSFSTANHYWTSGTDLAKQSRHVWFTTGLPITINAWLPNQPDNQGNKEHCDHLFYSTTSPTVRALNDAQCNTEMHYICEARQPYTVSFVVW